MESATDFVACATDFVACATDFVACATDFVACATDFVACATDFVACATDFVACATDFVARATDFVACGMLMAYDCIWSNEFADGTSVFCKPFSKEGGMMYRLLQDKATLVNGHYQLPLPWRPGFRFLPNNRQMALQRLSCLKKRLAKNPDLKQKYYSRLPRRRLRRTCTFA